MLIDPWLPESLATIADALVILATAVWAYRHTDADIPERTAGVVLLVGTSSYGWYALLLLALIAMSGSNKWSPIAIVPTFL